MEDKLKILKSLFESEDIQKVVGQIDEILSEMSEIPEEILITIKSAIQTEALVKLQQNNFWGLVIAATGVGKSKIAINLAEYVINSNKNARILIVVPTEKLRDENWKEEFKKWKLTKMYNKNIERSCYASISKLEGQIYDLVIMDEVHNITEANSLFFSQNSVIKCIGLTATYPEDILKRKILNDLNLKVSYSISLDMAVKLRLVAPYKITVIECRLDGNTKNCPGGTKEKPFMTTEVATYNYLTAVIKKLIFDKTKKAASKFAILRRMRFIYGLKSKTAAAKFILKNFINQTEDRTLIFCGSIAQAEELCENTFHSKTNDLSFIKFKKGQINTLSCVNSVNEGHNIHNIDNALIVQLNSNELHIIQRIGRTLRYRKGHEANIIILMVLDTVDEKWTKDSLSSLDQSRITYVRYSDLLARNKNNLITK